MPTPDQLFAHHDGSRPIDVLCLGNALVDRLAHASSEDVANAAMEPGAMTLVGPDRAHDIEQALSGWEQAAGGSAANTAAGIVSLGGTAAFAGAVGDDEPGAWYASDLVRLGVRCSLDTVPSGEPTGACHVLITPGGARSMATSLGAAGKLQRATVERAGVGEAAVVYIEGYLLDAPEATEALETAVELAKAQGTLVALSMSDPFVVTRHRERISALVSERAVDLVFGNEDEAIGLSASDSLEEALDWLDSAQQVAVITRGASGAVVTAPAGRTAIAAYPVSRVEDTTGAGDLFAAGCLYGITQGLSWGSALGLGAFAAAEIISHVGARPLVSLREAAPEDLLPASGPSGAA